MSTVKALQVTLCGVKHLPKMDTFGKCDPVITCSFGGVEKETKVIKKVYDATFDEVFAFELEGDDRPLGDLVIRVWDWERAGKNKPVGEVRLSEGRMVSVCAEEPGWSAEEELTVTRDGKTVKGHDSQQCCVSFKLEVLDRHVHRLTAEESKQVFRDKTQSSKSLLVHQVVSASPVDVDPEAAGARDLRVTVVSARHLPKMDRGFMGIGGKVDPFCVLDVGGTAWETSVKKGTFSPDYDETFTIATVVGGIESPLLVRVMDWNAVGDADLVGEVAVSRERLGELVRARAGWDCTDTFHILKGGDRVVGQDKKPSVLTLKFTSAVPDPVFPRLEAQEGAGGPRMLGLTVANCRNLPKMDTFGACDAFVEVVFEGEVFKTEVVKNSLTPDFLQQFDIPIDDVARGCARDVLLRVLDWNATQANELVGEARIPAARMSEILRSAPGATDTEGFYLSMKGKHVVGQSTEKAVLNLKVRMVEIPPAFSEIEGGEVGAGVPRRLELTVCAVSHLPKMDGLFGKCDPYIVVQFEGLDHRTSIVKNTYDCEWNDTFVLEASDAAAGASSDCIFTLFDWDAGSKDDLIGEVKVSAARMSEIFRGALGSEATERFTVMSEGKMVRGHDLHKTELIVRVKVCEAPVPFVGLAAEEGAEGARRLEITVASVKSLPKMDGMWGKCDAFAVLYYEGVECGRTETRKNAYEAVWDAVFPLDSWDAARGAGSDCEVKVFDWNATSKDEEVGSFRITAARLSELFRARVGESARDTFTLLQAGKPVVGHDKLRCQVALDVKVCEIPRAFPMVMPAEGEVKGPRRLVLTVCAVSHLPKMDGLFGKCDPYIVVQFEGEEYRTKTVKGVYDAEFGEAFDLDVEKVEEGVRRDCFVRVYDWDAASKDDEVGEIKISAARLSELFRADLGSSGSETFSVVAEGKRVIGHDKKPCELSLSVEVMKQPVAFAGVQPDAGAAGARRLMVSLCGVKHLPKMDGMFGKCDPYAVLQWEGAEYRTETVKNTYDADWDQGTFAIDVDDVSRGTRSDLIVEVWDWDAASKDDLIGSLKVPAARVSQLFAGALGSGGTEVMAVMNDGKAVVGHDKGRCEVTLRVKVCEAPRAFPTMLPSEGARGARRLLLTVKGVRHLPRMDGMFGKCDPFLTMQFDGVEHKTEVVKNTYEADFDETFALDVEDVSAMVRCDCLFTVWDWDMASQNMASQNDEVGVFKIPAGRMVELFQAPLGATGEETMIVQKDGKAVVGHDKQVCQVQLQARLGEVPRAFPTVELSEEEVSGPRRLVWTLDSVKSLPKMDGMWGKCDPFAVLHFEGIKYETAVKKSTYDCEWNESFSLEVGDASKAIRSDCRIVIMDWDAASKNQEIGSCKISAVRMTEMFRGKIGSAGTQVFTVLKAGKPVVGHDKQICEVRMNVTVCEVPKPFAHIEGAEGVTGPRRIEMTLKRCMHLPKKDGFGSKCDPYAIVMFEGQEFKTDIKRNTYDADWDEQFNLDVAAAEKSLMTDLMVQVFDYDMITKNDPIGVLTISATRMEELFRAELQSEGDESFAIISNGDPVVGHSGQQTVVNLRVRIIECPIAFDEEEKKEEKEEEKPQVDPEAKREARKKRIAKARALVREKEQEQKKSWWDEHPPTVIADKRGPVVASDNSFHPDMEVVKPEKGMRVEEVSVARSGGAGGTIIAVTSLPVREQGPRVRPLRAGEDGGDVGGQFQARGATRASWAVCVEWDTGVSHVYHARGDRTFNLRLLGGTRRMKGELDGSLREGMVVELSQEGRDWYVANTPTSVGLGGRGRVLRAFESNCEVLWDNSGVPLRVPNRFLCQRRTEGARRRLGKRVDAPTVRQTIEATISGGEVAVVHVECSTEGAVVRYAMDKPSAPGMTAGGTASHTAPGHAGWTVYQGPIRLPLEQRGQGLTHDVLLKVCATKPGCADSRVVGWVVQKGTIARWEQASPIWSTPLNVYQFDTASKFRAWPRPSPQRPGGLLDATSYARQRPVSSGMARNRV